MTALQSSTFSFTPREVIRAAQIYARPRARRDVLITAAVVGVGLVVFALPVVIVQVFMPEYSDWIWSDFLVTWRAQKWVLWPLAAFVLLSAFGRPLLWRYNVSRSMRQNADQYRDLQVSFDDAGMEFKWPNASSRTAWEFYDSVIESRDFFLLVYGTLYVAIPKRAWAESDVEVVAELLRSRIRNYQRRD